VDRTACVNIPGLPLQLLVRREPTYRQRPVAVVERDHPQAEVCFVNRMAWDGGVRSGARYGAALSLVPGLCGGVVERSELEQAKQTIIAALRDLSPHIEADARPGIFRLDGRGLDRIFGNATGWMEAIVARVNACELQASVVVGFTRFGAHAATTLGMGGRVFETPAQERAAVAGVPLERLGLAPTLLTALTSLGVTTVASLVALPADQLTHRYGPEAAALHRMASRTLRDEAGPLVPTQGAPTPVHYGSTVHWEHSERSRERLLHAVRATLASWFTRLASEGRSATLLRLVLERDGAPPLSVVVRAARPSTEPRIWDELLTLRLASITLDAGVVGFAVSLDPTEVAAGQIRMSYDRPRRDLDAAARALARVAADLGDAQVGRLVPLRGHLPEARARWQPGTSIAAPRPTPCATPQRTLVRRLWRRPHPLPPRARHEPDGWLVLGLEAGPIEYLRGPYIFYGGWWARDVHREYYYAQTRRGDLLWIYHDRRRRAWYLHATVE